MGAGCWLRAPFCPSRVHWCRLPSPTTFHHKPPPHLPLHCLWVPMVTHSPLSIDSSLPLRCKGVFPGGGGWGCDVLEERRGGWDGGGGVGWDPPSSRGPPRVPGEGRPKNCKHNSLGAEGTEVKFGSNIGKGGGGGGGGPGGGLPPPTVGSRSNTSLGGGGGVDRAPRLDPSPSPQKRAQWTGDPKTNHTGGVRLNHGR